MDMQALKDAIRMRKGKGVNIKLIIGAEPEEPAEKTGLAPGEPEKEEEDTELAAMEGEEMGEELGEEMSDEEKALMNMKSAHEGRGHGALLKKAMSMLGKK